MNYSDAERIVSVLKLAGYKTGREEEADLILVMACSVRQKAIDKIYGKSKRWQKMKRRKPDLRLVLSGCVLPEDRKKLSKIFDLVFDIKEIDDLKRFLNRNSKLPAVLSSGEGKIRNSGEYLNILPSYNSPFRAYVPIMTGCDNFCSYCAVPYTRGREVSRPEGEIVSEVRSLIERGYKEITLLGQNVNSYSVNKKDKIKNTKNQFVALLKDIDKIPGNYRVYFYSNHPKDFSDELIEALPRLKHFPPYIHLPLQSGDDGILRKMNRRYNSAEYSALIGKIRKKITDVALTTDIIVGFPGEGGKEFQNTVELVKKSEFDMIFVGQYSPRPGTPSAKMEETVAGAEKKERDRTITNILADRLSEENMKLVGKSLTVLIDEKKDSTFFGRTDTYKVVELVGRDHPEQNEGSPKIKTDQPIKIGQFYNVEIIRASAWKLFGVVIIPD